MQRREFIAMLGGVAAIPFAARAQQPAVPVIAMITSTSFSGARIAAFREGLKESGLVDGQNVKLENHPAHGQAGRMQGILEPLIRRPVSLIVSNSIATRAAMKATTTIPIVFVIGTDPIRDGLVSSLNRPGGNVTGTTFLGAALGTKRLDLLRQVAPHVRTFGALIYPDTAATQAERSEFEAAAQQLGLQLHVVDLRSSADFEPAFATLKQRGVAPLSTVPAHFCH